MYTLKYTTTFDAAHKLENYIGKCANLHGHEWKVEIELRTLKLLNDMVFDFTILEKIVNQYDHHFLNDFIENPTAENIAKIIYDEIDLASKSLEREFLIKVIIWESPNSSVSYEL